MTWVVFHDGKGLKLKSLVFKWENRKEFPLSIQVSDVFHEANEWKEIGKEKRRFDSGWRVMKEMRDAAKWKSVKMLLVEVRNGMKAAWHLS